MIKDVLRSRPALLLLAMAAVASLTFAQGSAQSSNDIGTQSDHLHHYYYAESARVPEKARERQNPLASDPDAVAAGGKLFEQHCAECHGHNAEGSRKAPALCAEAVQQATDGTLFWILTNGVVRRGMPVWSKLPEAERWQIVRFLKSLNASQERAKPHLDTRTR